MKSLVIKVWPYLTALVAVAIVTCCSTTVDKAGILCTDKYALCTSAKCLPDPNDKNKTICTCKVHTGINFGQEACEKRQPFTDSQGLLNVISTYSFEQYSKDKTLTCPDGNAWSYCLDKPCTINPNDPTKAICSCDVRNTGSFVTLGGNCDKSTCKTAFWSGAPGKDTEAAMKVLTKAMGLSQQPDNFCPN